MLQVITMETTDSNQDILTIKYSSSGSLLWSKRYEYLSNNAANYQYFDKIQWDCYDYVVVKRNEKGTIRMFAGLTH